MTGKSYQMIKTSQPSPARETAAEGRQLSPEPGWARVGNRRLVRVGPCAAAGSLISVTGVTNFSFKAWYRLTNENEIFDTRQY